MAISLNINRSSLLLHVTKMCETYSRTNILKSDILDIKLYFPWMQSWSTLSPKIKFHVEKNINNQGGFFFQADSEKRIMFLKVKV